MFLYFHSKFQVSFKVQQHLIGLKMLSQKRVATFTVVIFSTMVSAKSQHLIENKFIDVIPVNILIKSITRDCTLGCIFQLSSHVSVINSDLFYLEWKKKLSQMSLLQLMAFEVVSR